MQSSNFTINLIDPYPIWYFINDILIILLNIIGISVAILFMYTLIRLEYPSYSISNLIACKTCFAIGLMSLAILLNNCYALASDFRGVGHIDSLCRFRGRMFSVLFIKMYTSLCLKAFNRVRCVVYRIRAASKSYKYLFIVILIQWCFVAILALPIVLNDGVDYDWGSHLCLITIEKSWQFSYLMTIYTMSLLFISSVYFYILHYVIHVSPLPRYRQKRQLALLRRIVILLLMIVLPGLSYFLLIIYWNVFHSMASYSFKLITLLESVGHTGAILTIFISNTRVRGYLYHKRKISQEKKKKKTTTTLRRRKLSNIQRENFDLLSLEPVIIAS